MEDRVQTVRDSEDPETVIRNLDQLSSSAQAITTRVAALETIAATKNTKQSAVTNLSYVAATISATYTQAEVQQLATDIKTLADKIDALLASLRSADILS